VSVPDPISRAEYCQLGKALLGAMALLSGLAQAGPPFRSDDPGIVDEGHYELLPFYSQTLAEGGRSGALPGLELHYGLLKGVEVDLILQAAFSTPPGAGTGRGFGDTEIDVKVLLADETETRPAIAFIPKFVLPTGNADRGLGNGGSQVFVPLWMQKSFGKFTTYGGGGYWFNNGTGNRNDWFFGGVTLYQVSDAWLVGGEIFHSTPQTVAQGASTGFTIGAMYQIDEHSQLLISAGKGLQDAAQTNRVSTYLGCLLSF
jgi:hypothetical protein